MLDSPLSPDPDPQILQQEVKGNQNQVIGQVLGGMVVYGQVIYNTFVEADSSTAKTKASSKIGPNPYKGLLAFQEMDGDRFFGRGQQIKDLWEKFRRLHEDKSAVRLLMIYGPSGSGKSSLARAGLIPELERCPLPGRDRARVAVLFPGSHPLEALATVLARIATNDPTPIAKTREFAAELTQANSEGVYDGLRRIADALPEIATSPLIVLVDQLEEVFTLCKDLSERKAFIGNLVHASAEGAKRVSVIVTLRSDFLGSTQEHPQLNQLISDQGFFVAAMSSEGLREAITKPAELAGYSLDPSTVRLLMEQTEDREGALPLLQFALTRIWAGLIEGKEPAETLEAIGGVGGALAGEAQRIYESLGPNEQEIARRVFLGLVQLGEGTKDTRRRTELKRLVSHRDSLEQVQKVIARFADPGTRLITLSGDVESMTVEVTHEALFEHWQQLKRWLDKSRSDLRFQRRLDEAAMVWQGNERPEGNLWRSPDLDLLQRYYERAGDDMTPLQVEFFNASVNAQKAQKQAIEKAAKEKKQQQMILVGGLLVAAFASFQLYQAQKESQWEQLVSKIYDAKPTPQLLSDLDKFLEGVKIRSGEANLALQHSYYRKALFAANSLDQVITTEAEKQKLKKIHEEAEGQLGTLINKYKLDELTNHLKTGSIKAALEETRRILLEETGGDLDRSKGLSSDDEGRQIPCKTLEEIGKRWTNKLSPQPCAWSTYPQADGCTALDKHTLTLAVFQYDYESFPLLRNRLKTCRLV
jgi:energy-coupling factor transporter ATP-binding protein EcfA2